MESSELGYILDFMASFFVVSSIILRSNREIHEETATLMGGNPLAFEAQLKASRDGWIAVVQFFIGLIFHLYHFHLGIVYSVLLILSIGLISYLVYVKTSKSISDKVRKNYEHYDIVKRRAEGKKE